MINGMPLILASLCIACINQVNDFRQQQATLQVDNTTIETTAMNQLQSLLAQEQQCLAQLILDYLNGVSTIDDCRQLSVQTINLFNQHFLSILQKLKQQSLLKNLSQSELSEAIKQSLTVDEHTLAQILQQAFDREIKPLLCEQNLFEQLRSCWAEHQANPGETTLLAAQLASYTYMAFRKSHFIFELDGPDLKRQARIIGLASLNKTTI